MFYQVAPNQKQFIVNLLTKQGITPTQQRVEIGMVLLTKTQHLSADQLLERVNVKSPVASKATVYNTLGLFVEHGLVQEVIVDSKKVFYDSNTTPHHHFFNIDTGTLHDIALDQVEIKNLPTLPDSATLKDVNIVFRVEKNKDERTAETSNSTSSATETLVTETLVTESLSSDQVAENILTSNTPGELLETNTA